MKIGKLYKTNPDWVMVSTFSSAGSTENYSYPIWDQPKFKAIKIGVFDGEMTSCICKCKQDFIYDKIYGKKEMFLLLEYIPNEDPENPWGWLKIFTEKGLVGYIHAQIDDRWIEVFE